MKVMLKVVLLLGLAVPAFSATPVVDFDGQTSKTENVNSYLGNAEISSPDASIDSGIGVTKINHKTGTKAVENFLVLSSISADNQESYIRREVMMETGEWVELKAIKIWVDEYGITNGQYSVLPGAKLRRAFSCPRRTRLNEVYDLQNETGGHFHNEIPSPLLSVSSPSLSASATPIFHAVPSPMTWAMPAGTTYYYWEQLPVFATMIVEDFSSDLCGQWTDILSVEIRGLKAMPEGKDYVLYSSEDAKNNHPYNHYGTQALITAIKSIAGEYKAVFSDAEPLQIGDMSLFSGGIFDLKHDWMVPHTGHNFGADADISKNTVPRANRQKLLGIMCRRVPGTYLDPDLPEFYHVNVPVEKAAIESIFGKAVRCCVGNEIDPNNIDVCTAN